MLNKFQTISILFLLILMPVWASGQSCPDESLINRQVRASETDAEIPFELFRHQVWLNPACESNGLLLVHLPGTFDNPSRTTFFPALAANHGYHALGLHYPNDISAQTVCRESSNPDCYADFRREIVEGSNWSPAIEINQANSIENRLQKLLQFLAQAYPAEGWGDFLNGEEIIWGKLVISGHSQGGGHAAFMAKDRVLARAIMFASPNDYDAVNDAAAAWTSDSSLTADSLYYAFGNRFDDIVEFREEYLQWDALGMAAFGDTVNVLQNSPHYAGSRMLYTTEQKPGLAVNHSLMITDEQLTLENGIPIYTPVWEYLLGVGEVINDVTEIRSDGNLKIWPNPANDVLWVDADTNGAKRVEVRLLSVYGQVLGIAETTAEASTGLDCSKLANGVYLVQVWQDGQYVQGQRLIVAH